MTTSLFGGRSRHGHSANRSSRSKASVSRARQRPTQVDNQEEHAPTEEAAKPTLEELRRKRLQYIAMTPDARRRLNAKSATSKVKPGASVTSSHIQTAHRERRKRRSRDKSSSRASGRRKKEESTRTEDHVYGPPSRARAEQSESELEPQSEYTRQRTSRSGRQSARPSHSIRRHTLPTVIEADLTPDDSISQVGVQTSHVSSRRGPSSRSMPNRSSTLRASLPVDSERSSSVKPGAPSAREGAKRQSQPSLLGLLRRNTAPAVPTPPRLVECLTCAADDVPHAKSAKLACGHRMCHECLRRIFEMSITDPAHMPPKCCTDQHIPLQHVDKLFDLKFKLLWNRKFQEYHTMNRIYCPAPKCGEWIKPSHIHTSQGRKYAQCPRCETKVCTLCNGKLHKAKECPKDPEIAKLVAQAKQEGWQSCYSCNAMVELKEGCNHMTCRCRAEFCMVCGAKWKTCECPWFNYSQLPDPDRLMDWRVPEPIQVIYRRAFAPRDPARPDLPPTPPAPRQGAGPAAAGDRQRAPTYTDEMEQRRRQERLDADLARRLQLASLLDPEEGANEQRRRRNGPDMWGLGNAAQHFMNDDFVQNAANVVMSAFGDPAMGRRGDRASARRRRPPREAFPNEEPGLVHNFLGDESVIGAAAPPGESENRQSR